MASQFVKDSITAQEIENAQGYILVDFWAEWCAPCKRLTPIFLQAAEQNKDVKFYKLNVDESPELSSSFNIRSIPTMILFKNGQPIQTRVGGMDLISLNEWISQYTK